ncbi:PTS sugar transporter subunit IIA [Liquorilactobacillus vini]|uniref:PTS EIIA type-4 domain-containing protein n=1 Tax=Liquorilactobacillus vini DSM 20605 TaxID=1133569 RepID=A0A0R2BZ56_9LACO|nr:PTS fructose IIA component [Liquorilactobacillus vini]KRM83922.1 hypothetical protein FD21_GL000177 [Liquorilactobacillus vini DSM 20605]
MKIILLSHGHLASGMKNTVELITGKRDNLIAFDAYVDKNKDINEFLDSLMKLKERFVVITDIMGGSVNRLAMEKLNHKDVLIVTGMNAALVLDVVLLQENISKEKIEKAIIESKKMTKLLLPENEKVISDQIDEDF